MGEDDSTVIKNLQSTIENVSVRHVEEGGQFDFSGARLDWVRLQVSSLHHTDTN